jgi:hypothetical protein
MRAQFYFEYLKEKHFQDLRVDVRIILKCTGWTIGVLGFVFQGGMEGNLSHHHRIQNGSGAHSAAYPVGTRGSFTGGKVAGE